MRSLRIPRVVIAAAQSGSGKTTLVAGMLAAWRRQGLRVQAYKVGPDYIDPGYHALASGMPGHNLDSWLVPANKLPEIFFRTAASADLAVIEGVMGLYDGGRQGISSTAEIAKMLQAPVLLVLDVKSMGASAAAVALGFRQYDPAVPFAGVILNRLGSVTHRQMIEEAMSQLHLPVFGCVYRDDVLHLPERHLGLLPVSENPSAAIERLGDCMAEQVQMESVYRLARGACPLHVPECAESPLTEAGLPRLRIGVVRDEAFSFYYEDSLQVLKDCGVELIPLSLLHDSVLPDVDGLLIGGGFPEMFARQLAENQSMKVCLRRAADAGMPIYGECGGYMYLLEQLVDFAGNIWPMAGLLPGQARMKERLQMVGYVEAVILQSGILGAAGTKLHGHEFHFSVEDKRLDRKGADWAFQFIRLRNGQKYMAGGTRNRVLGSYLHIHFAGCPEAVRALLAACAAYRAEWGVS